MSGHRGGFPTQGHAADTLRWGSRNNIAIVDPGGNSATLPTLYGQAVAIAQAAQGKQLVNAHWPWPLSWQTAVIINPQMAPDETGSVIVGVEFTIGSGDGNATWIATYTVSPPYNPIFDPYQGPIPAADVLVRVAYLAQVTETSGLTNLLSVNTDNLEVGVFAAPVTEAHALRHLLEGFSKDERFGAGEREGGWMPPGFHPEPLGYRR